MKPYCMQISKINSSLSVKIMGFYQILGFVPMICLISSGLLMDLLLLLTSLSSIHILHLHVALLNYSHSLSDFSFTRELNRLLLQSIFYKNSISYYFSHIIFALTLTFIIASQCQSILNSTDLALS